MAPAPLSPIDRAYDRYQILTRLLDLARQRALGDPTHERNVGVGLTTRGQTREDAVRNIEDAFEDLGGLVNHVAILDMAGVFESHFRARLDTAIGEARKVVRERFRSSVPLHAHRESLIHDADDFQGLADIGRLIGHRVSAEVQDNWEMIRKNRNSFAHGTDIRRPPTITSERTKDTLKEIIEAL